MQLASGSVRVLVTGGVGFIGSTLIWDYVERGETVHAIVRPGTASHRLEKLPGVVLVHPVDLVDPNGVNSVIGSVGPDLVVHGASSPGHPATSAGRLAAWRDDVTATATLLEALGRHPPQRLVTVGSSLVYRPSDGPLDEKAPLGPETARGAAKLAASTAVEQWSAVSGVPTVEIRPFSVYGPRERPNRVIPTLLRSLRSGRPFAVTAGEARRDFTHVSDVARSIVLASLGTRADGRVLNIGTGVETSIKELIATAERVTGRTVELDELPHPSTPPRRPHWRSDSSLAREVLGWKPEIDLEQGLRMLWEAGV